MRKIWSTICMLRMDLILEPKVMEKEIETQFLVRDFSSLPQIRMQLLRPMHKKPFHTFKSGPKGLARSMPTSGVVDRVAEKLKLPFFEVHTGWKFFGNIMDAAKFSVCGKKVSVQALITFMRKMVYGL